MLTLTSYIALKYLFGDDWINWIWFLPVLDCIIFDGIDEWRKSRNETIN